jgi:1-acyl-sn-glycerol-3-phosphate acyltransferase
LSTLRVFRKAAAFGLLTTAICVVLYSGAAVLFLSRRPGERWRALMLRIWARNTVRIIGMRIDLRGKPPEAPFFLVSNHLGYVDVITLGGLLDCAFVSRADVADWPFFGWASKAGNTVFLDRGRKRDLVPAIRRISALLEKGIGVVVFPEGSSTDGSSVLRFKPSLLEAAAKAGIPVSYASVTYHTPLGGSARTDVCWWGKMNFPAHLVRLFRLRSIEATVEFGEQRILEPDRKLLAGRLWEAVVRQFRPVVQ